MLGAALMTNPSTQTIYFGLYLNGLDIIRQSTVKTSYGAPLDDIAVTEQAAGGVSDLQFSIDDPLRAVTLQAGMLVRFERYNGVLGSTPLFLGFIQSWSITPVGTGRRYEVRCIGYDALLDWMIVGSTTIPTGTQLTTAVQHLVGIATGVGYRLNDASLTQTGSQAAPTGALFDPMLYDVVIAGSTLRNAIQDCIAAARFVPANLHATFWVDMWGGLRMIYDYASGASVIPGDYVTVTVDDTNMTPSQENAESIQYENDATGAIHQVWVTGGNAAGTGLVGDGSGLPGPVAQFADSTILTADARDVAGLNYLVEHGAERRAQLTLDARSTITTRAGTNIVWTDTQLGITSLLARVYTIRKTFYAANQAGNNERWTLTIGAPAKSALRQTRRLTRGVLS